MWKGKSFEMSRDDFICNGTGCLYQTQAECDSAEGEIMAPVKSEMESRRTALFTVLPMLKASVDTRRS